MEVTSYFIGIKINSRVLTNLFVALQQYLRENNLENAVELQNIHSLHITLYYLEKELSPLKLDSIKDSLTDLNKSYENLVIHPEQIAYFKKGEEDVLGYIACSQQNQLEQINKNLSKEYHNYDIVDNQFIYLPHISLFKIINYELLLKYKEILNRIITEKLSEVISQNLFQGFFLFEVNSKFHPEIQMIVDSF